MIRLFGYWRSSAAYRVRIALNLKGLEYESVPISLAPDVAEQRSESYRLRNPQMLVPYLEDGDVCISQSMAMLEYLDERYPEVPLLPADEPLRSKARAFAQVIACDVHPLQNVRVQQRVKSEYDGDGIAWAQHWMTAGFEALEALSGDGSYVFGDSPTQADILLIPQMYNARRFNVPLHDYPSLRVAEETCGKLKAFRAAAPKNQPDAVSEPK